MGDLCNQSSSLLLATPDYVVITHTHKEGYRSCNIAIAVLVRFSCNATIVQLLQLFLQLQCACCKTLHLGYNYRYINLALH